MLRLKSKAHCLDLVIDCSETLWMKSHLFISSGLLVAAIFFMRGLEAISVPGLGMSEVYILGGFLVAGLLIHSGWKERKAH